MSTWTTISNAAVAVGGIPASSTVTALRDNPIAIAKAASGSPAVFAGWHPVDKDTVGDAEDGLIYNSAVDGALASVETPEFDDGYEYRIIAKDITSSANSTLRLGLYQATSASWINTDLSGSIFLGDQFTCDIDILMPRMSAVFHLFRAITVRLGGDDSVVLSAVVNGYADFITSQKVGKARIIFSAGNVNGGKIWLLRRREYISSP
jgi:hypothetical protein